jgi:hypothetical protein
VRAFESMAFARKLGRALRIHRGNCCASEVKGDLPWQKARGDRFPVVSYAQQVADTWRCYVGGDFFRRWRGIR